MPTRHYRPKGALSRSKEQSAAAAEAARAAAEAAVAERVQALDEQCAAQLELIDRQASELLERQASQRGDMAHELERRTPRSGRRWTKRRRSYAAASPR